MHDHPPGQSQPEDESRDEHPDRTIIDVSGDRPEVVESEEDAGTLHTQVRVFTARGGPAGCVIPLALLALLLCCSCVGAWAIVDNLF